MKPVIEIDNDNSQRLHYRVVLHPDDLVSLEVAGVKVDVLDISAKGVAFRYQGEVSKKFHPMLLTFFFDKEYSVACNLKINWCKNNEYGAEYIDMDDKDFAAISRLIIECQKRDIRRTKEQEIKSR